MSAPELDLEEAERAVRLELARVIERGIKADIGEYAVQEALPHILKAVADQIEDTTLQELQASQGVREWAVEYLRKLAEDSQ